MSATKRGPVRCSHCLTELSAKLARLCAALDDIDSEIARDDYAGGLDDARDHILEAIALEQGLEP